MGRATMEDGYSAGSVRKHGKRWQAVVYKRENGGRKQIAKTLSVECKPGKGDNTGKKTAMAEMAAWRSELLEADRAGVPAQASVAPCAETVWEYCTRYVADMEARRLIEASTVRDYLHMLKYLNDDMRDTPLCDLTPAQIERWQTELLSVRGLSAATVKKAHRVLRQCMRHAVEMEEIDRDPTARVKPPRPPRKEPNALDAAGRARLVAALAAMGPTPLKAGASLALYAGMRIGEVCGLRWRNVDLSAGVVHVREAIGSGLGGTYSKEPKTGGSRRDIPMPEALAEIVRERRAAVLDECMAAGIALSPDMYVCGRIDGAYMNPTTLTKQWGTIAEAFGLIGTQGTVCTFHDLRHTFATTAIAEGADVKSVSSILGHANAAMTLNVYAAADPEAKRAAMERVNEAMGRRVAEVIEFRPTGTDGKPN